MARAPWSRAHTAPGRLESVARLRLAPGAEPSIGGLLVTGVDPSSAEPEIGSLGADREAERVGEHGQRRLDVTDIGEHVAHSHRTAHPPVCAVTVAEMLEIPREPFWDPTVRVAWPTYVALREGGAAGAAGTDGLVDLRRDPSVGVIFYLGEGDNIHIEMPTANRTSF